LVFFGSSRLGSWLLMESVCSTCCVRDMMGGSARLGESIGGVKGSRRGREEWWERAGLRSAKPLSQISDRAAAPRLHACGAYASPPETLSLSRTYHGLVIAAAAQYAIN